MTAALEQVYLRKCKRPTASGVWSAYVLAEDPDGMWLYTPAGSLYRGTNGDSVGYCESGMDSDGAGRSTVHLIPSSGWWFATWIDGGDEPAVAIDICTPATRVGPEWTYVDLELDPYKQPDGTVGVDDWDEFVAACAAGVISRSEEAAARSATARLEEWLTDRVEPFGDKGSGWLNTARGMGLVPLTDLDDVPVFPEQRPG